jgi:hypothetical protein
LCTLPANQGYLCDAHRKAILSPGLTSEQISSRRSEGSATLVDPWGNAWPVGDPTIIGRSLGECDLTLLHSSISLVHAAIERDGDGWRIVDKGSRNGTFVDSARVESARLSDGARVRIGEVALFFVDRKLAHAEQPTGPGRTAPSRRDQLIFTAALRGAGDTRVPVLFTWIGFLGVRVPLAYLLTSPPFSYGLFGAWLAMSADLFVRGSFFWWRFSSGRWKHAVV